MSPALIGGLVGAAVGFIGFAICRIVAGRIDRSSVKDRERISRVLRSVGYLVLVIDTSLGYYVGPLVLGG
jgi:uncharacterized protein (DUF2236 family)